MVKRIKKKARKKTRSKKQTKRVAPSKKQAKSTEKQLSGEEVAFLNQHNISPDDYKKTGFEWETLNEIRSDH